MAFGAFRVSAGPDCAVDEAGHASTTMITANARRTETSIDSAYVVTDTIRAIALNAAWIAIPG